MNRTYAKLAQLGVPPKAVRLYDEAAQRRSGAFASVL